MDLFAIDDSAQRKPSRDGMGPLVAVGGIHVPGDNVRPLELCVEKLCRETGFPAGEEFKWSPERGTWMHTNLKYGDRDDFLARALALAVEANARAIVIVEDSTKRPASKASRSHEEDVITLFLERAHAMLPAGQQAIVIFDRPSGDRRAEVAFLTTCIATMREGTPYVLPDRLALALATDSRLVRLLQLADVVTACTLAYVAGEEKFAPKVFEGSVYPLLREELGRIGGVGLKIHPDFRYANLYHWLLGDDTWWKGSVGVPLPSNSCTSYRESPDVA